MLYTIAILAGFFVFIRIIFRNNERLRERRNKDSIFHKRRFKR
ncbi:hypothetical protein SAMN04515667_2770 [Formosa sp. Hel1_31_208]|nr:hypothetical protein [Formosa sp. Hel1_31_208]SDS69908.1 hypothetical protein SAMN04515667_2770 [Formosa sp. Hel1_31_208]